MAKRKLTPEILELIEMCASEEYTFDEVREEADIIRPLMLDQKVIAAIERGRSKWFIELVSTDGDMDTFIYYSNITYAEIEKMFELHKEAIKLRKAELKIEEQQREDEKIVKAKHRLSPLSVGESNIYLQEGEENRQNIDRQTLKEELELSAKRMQNGDTSLLIEILTYNIMQLHHFNGQDTGNLAGDLGKQLSTFEKLSNMQLKVMQETRKSIMAINEITNPKRTTFIKKAEQHNHLHQNSEKKDKNENELQKLGEAAKCDTISDTEILSSEEAQNEKKFH
jgi:hypothetical protein